MNSWLVRSGPLTHSPLFVGVLFLGIALLGMNVSRLRMETGILAADGGDDQRLRRAQRAHGNAVEHGVLLAVLLMLIELQGAGKHWVVAFGVALLLARAAHAGGFLAKVKAGSTGGAAFTYTLELLGALSVIIQSARYLLR